jgi:YesN/AraC family two-component response regulator
MSELFGSKGTQKSTASVLIIADRVFHGRYRLLSMEGVRSKLTACAEDLSPPALEGVSIVIIDCGARIDRALELLRDIKQRSPHVIVVILTDQGSEEQAVQAFRLGARDYIKKPIELSKLQALITDLIEIKSQSRERRKALLRGRDRESEVSLKGAEEKPESIHRTLYFISQNLDKKITLEDCAKAAKLSKYHFCRKFKKHMGQSPQSYLVSQRIERAKTLLGGGLLNVSEAGFAAGFSSYNGFLQNFKKIMGMTPKQYCEKKNRGELD